MRTESTLTVLKGADLRLSGRALAEPPKEVLPDVQRFVEECVVAGKLLNAPGDRRIVRGLIQYWATYQYRHTGHYHLPELVAADTPLQHMMSRSASEIAVSSEATVEHQKRYQAVHGLYVLRLPQASADELHKLQAIVQGAGGSLRAAHVRGRKGAGHGPTESDRA